MRSVLLVVVHEVLFRCRASATRVVVLVLDLVDDDDDDDSVLVDASSRTETCNHLLHVFSLHLRLHLAVLLESIISSSASEQLNLFCAPSFSRGDEFLQKILFLFLQILFMLQ